MASSLYTACVLPSYQSAEASPNIRLTILHPFLEDAKNPFLPSKREGYV